MSPVTKSTFIEDLIRLNRLDKLGFGRLIFQPGMEFGTRDKWWEDTGSRPTPHEGLDLCCFEDNSGRLVYLAGNTLVPVLYDGTLVNIFTDFLGESILLAHDFQDNGRNLHSIYAHTVPDKALRRGSRVKAGEVIASTCPSKNKSMNPHLHLTVLWAPETAIATLDWATINQADHVILCDPLDFL